jgi:hypothetical protein
VNIDLAYRPRAWQRECHLKRRRFTVLALHRRAGKTELALMELIDKAMRFTEELGLFFYITPELKQAKTVAWLRLKARLEPLRVAGGVAINESELSVTFLNNNAIIRLYGADNPDAMRGVRLDGVVIDEVGQVKPEVWDAIVRPALADRLGWALIIGTPKGVNLFSALFYRARELHDWHSARYTVYDTDAIDPNEVATIRAQTSEAYFAQEYLCDFTAAGLDQLISLMEAEDACHRVYKPGEMDYAPVILGVDPARFGDDRSVIFRRQGMQAFDPEVMEGIDNMQLAAKVAVWIDKYHPDAVMIDSGNGGGVIDRLRQMGHDVIEVNFGGKSSSKLYANKRAEMWFGMRDWLRQGGAIPNINALKQDLAAPTYKYNPSNAILLEPKDDIKKRGLPSPDLGDALALTFAHPVAKRKLLPQTTRALDYDPLAQLDGFHKSSNREYDPLAFNR